MSDVLYVIDTMSLIFQNFHALPKDMSSPKGQPTNAVFGFSRDLQNILQNRQATHVICAMDSEGPGEREALYEAYKANRSETPDDLKSQIPLILDVIRGFNVPVIEHPGWEADDIIATLAVEAVADGLEVRIVTSDKDIRQLLSPNVLLYNCRKNEFFGEEELKQTWGIRPDQVIDFQSLVGDSVDNVPGVPLVGPKKAQALLEQFGTLEDVLANADKAPGKKLSENLRNFAGQARMSRELVRLRTDLPLDYHWDAARVGEPNREVLFQLFSDLGFGRMSEEMREGAAAAKKPKRAWETVDTSAKFDAFLKELRKQKRFCFDLETTSLDALRADIVGWAFSWQPHQAVYIPVDGPPGSRTLDAKLVLDAVRPLLEDPQIEVVNQNIKYDMLVLRRVGVRVEGIGLDPMIGDYLLDAGARSHGMDHLAQKYLKHKMIPISDLIGTGKTQKLMFEVDVNKAAEYASEDADIALQLADCITEQLKQQKLWDLYWDLERPLIPVLVDMEATGITVDVAELKRQSDELVGRLDELMGEIYQEAGREFNIGSPKQLAEVLFVEHDLPVLKKTKTGPSTSHDVLEKLAMFHPLPAKIIDHRHLSKLKSTYLDALPLAVNPETGRIHTSFNQVVAATGRLSSNEPNLQNIPIRTEEGRRVRRAFVAGEPGWKLVAADYSQVELRLLAHFSRDEELMQAFQEGQDIHTAVAADVFGVDPENVDRDQRRIAKAVNFGVLYGQSPFGLSEQLGIPQGDAAAFIENYFAKYPGVDRYLQDLLREVDRTGYAKTILGRRREIQGIRNVTGRQRNLSERTAINTVIQGSAADLIKRAMINVHARLAESQHPGRMLLQIHDELVFETPAAEVDSLVALARKEMESAFQLDVPLTVDVSVGDNWLDMRAV
jgi:DNA polymerase I